MPCDGTNTAEYRLPANNRIMSATLDKNAWLTVQSHMFIYACVLAFVLTCPVDDISVA